MADPRFRVRQNTLYLPTKDDLDRWRKLAPPLTLNQWIFLMVEKALEPAPTSNSDDINKLRKENLDLYEQNELLTTRLQQALGELQDLRKGSAPTMDKSVVEILKGGGVWTSINIFKKLALNKFVKNVETESSDNTAILDTKSIEKTLDTLQEFNLIESTWQGWKWKK